jgi:hypothetical protein
VRRADVTQVPDLVHACRELIELRREVIVGVGENQNPLAAHGLPTRRHP